MAGPSLLQMTMPVEGFSMLRFHHSPRGMRIYWSAGEGLILKKKGARGLSAPTIQLRQKETFSPSQLYYGKRGVVLHNPSVVLKRHAQLAGQEETVDAIVSDYHYLPRGVFFLELFKEILDPFCHLQGGFTGASRSCILRILAPSRP